MTEITVSTVLMEKIEFVQLFMASLPNGLSLQNPSRGTSTIIWCDGQKVCYKRGNLRLYIDLSYLFEAFRHFNGRLVTTNNLKEMAPQIFDSDRNGHNCHCTFFFMALRQMGIVNEILGTGRVGSPFGISLPAL